MRRLAVAVAAAQLAGCAGAPGTPRPAEGDAASCRDAWADAPSASRQACRKQWTVLVYMAADNEDMPPYAYLHLNEMEAAFDDPYRSAASTVDADVLVQLDLRDPPGIRRLHMRRAEVPRDAELGIAAFAARTPDDIRSPVVELLEEETIPPEESLRRFLAWGIAAYPSEHYLAVVWGHGLGWRPAGLAGEPYSPGSLRGGIAFDESQRTVLDTPGLRAALEGASRDALGGRPFDVQASDACLMQSLEVTTEIAAAARYVVGSEQIEDYLGLPWRTFLPRLNGTAEPPPDAPPDCAPEDAACSAARLLPELQREAFAPGGIYAGLSPDAAETFVLSAVDTEALARAVLPALQRLSAALVAYLEEDPLRRIDLQVLLDVERGPGSAGGGVPDFLGGTRDVGVFLSYLRAQIEGEAEATGGTTPAAARLRDEVDAAEAALDDAVLAAAYGASYDPERWPGMAGAAVWLPHDAAEFARRAPFFAPSPVDDPPAPPSGGASFWAWLEALFAEPPAGLTDLNHGSEGRAPKGGKRERIHREAGRRGGEIFLRF